jgi:hypothetical protein
MNQTFSKSLHHFYTLFKVYFCIALGAALLALVYGGLGYQGFTDLALLIVFGSFMVILRTWRRLLAHKLETQDCYDVSASPPKFPRRLLHIMYKDIAADFDKEYYRWIRLTGKLYADVWYWKMLLSLILRKLVKNFRIGVLKVFRIR